MPALPTTATIGVIDAAAIGALAASRLVIEAIVENLEIKHQVFAQSEVLCEESLHA